MTDSDILVSIRITILEDILVGKSCTSDSKTPFIAHLYLHYCEGKAACCEELAGGMADGIF